MTLGELLPALEEHLLRDGLLCAVHLGTDKSGTIYTDDGQIDICSDWHESQKVFAPGNAPRFITIMLSYGIGEWRKPEMKFEIHHISLDAPNLIECLSRRIQELNNLQKGRREPGIMQSIASRLRELISEQSTPFAIHVRAKNSDAKGDIVFVRHIPSNRDVLIKQDFRGVLAFENGNTLLRVPKTSAAAGRLCSFVLEHLCIERAATDLPSDIELRRVEKARRASRASAFSGIAVVCAMVSAWILLWLVVSASPRRIIDSVRVGEDSGGRFVETEAHYEERRTPQEAKVGTLACIGLGVAAIAFWCCADALKNSR